MSASLCYRTCIEVASPDDFPILVPFDSLLMRGEHWIRLFGLFEEAAFAATLALHHQVVMFSFNYSWLIQIIVYITLVT